MSGNFVGMCKSYPMGMEIFMGMGMEKKKKNFCLVGHGKILFGHRNFLLVMEYFFVGRGKILFGHGNFCWS